MKLIKFIKDSLKISRRESEALIFLGEISINGKPTNNIIEEVSSSDIIKYKGKVLSEVNEKKQYILLNKPKNYVTTLSDEHNRKTVLDLIPDIKERVYPVGRLDKESSGLLLLTNDSDFMNRLSHPKFKVEKEYIVRVNGVLNLRDLDKLKKGVYIFDGQKKYKTKPAIIQVLKERKDHAEYKVIISEGKNRQIRRMFLLCGLKVLSLKRVRIKNIYLGHLIEGTYRNLSKNEIKKLMDETK